MNLISKVQLEKSEKIFLYLSSSIICRTLFLLYVKITKCGIVSIIIGLKNLIRGKNKIGYFIAISFYCLPMYKFLLEQLPLHLTYLH